ncbi:hypothetical protein BS78_06G254700 [Paspalum vaginatum]|nr:hypothetical protein BS78_06G254700 [Paspalum vaginatum]
MGASSFSLAEAMYVAGDVVLQSVRAASVRVRSYQENVASVKLPKFTHFVDPAAASGGPSNASGLARGGKQVAACRAAHVKAIEDIWCHVHSLMPLQYAAQSACVFHTFLRSWRCHPYLNFTDETLFSKQNASRKGYMARHFTMRVDKILENHSGIGVKALNLTFPDYCKVDAGHLNRWLQIAITPGIEEVILFLPTNYKKQYSFPCSLLFGACGNSVRHIRLTKCAFRPPVGFDCLKSLTELYLYDVCITGDELGSLTSNCFALEQLELANCGELIFLEIPLSLERLSFLRVSECHMLQVIESKAPNLLNFEFVGELVHFYAITKLPSAVPNLETIEVTSFGEMVNTPMVADKFLNLKYLHIHLTDACEVSTPAYDYLSLVSFLDASPALETFILSVDQEVMKHDSVFGDASHVRQIPGHKHSRLRKVHIIGFCSAKSMVELTCHILENATSLESLIIDTINDPLMDGDGNRSCATYSECWPIGRDMILEGHKALKIVNMYIVGRAPPALRLDVKGPCSRCHAID